MECKLAEREYSCLLSEHDDHKEILQGDKQEANLESTMPTRPTPISRDPTRAVSYPSMFEQPYPQPIVKTPVGMPYSTLTESRTFRASSCTLYHLLWRLLLYDRFHARIHTSRAQDSVRSSSFLFAPMHISCIHQGRSCLPIHDFLYFNIRNRGWEDRILGTELKFRSRFFHTRFDSTSVERSRATSWCFQFAPPLPSL